MAETEVGPNVGLDEDGHFYNLFPPRFPPELYQGYGEDHAEYLGEDPLAPDRIEP